MSGEGGSASLISNGDGGGGTVAATTQGTVTQDTTQQTQQTQQTQAFDHTKWDYRTALPEDIKADPVFEKYKNIEGVFRGLQAAQKMIGKDPSTLAEIKSTMTAAERRALAGRMGVPEKADGYKFEPVKDAPEWLDAKQPLGKWFAETAHAAGIHPEEANVIYQGFSQQMMQAAAAQQAAAVQQADKMVADLKTELGDKFDTEVRAANFAVKQLGGKELADALNGADLGVHPAVIKMLAKVGHMLAESTDGGDKPGFDGGNSASSDKAKAMQLIAESHTPKYDKDPIGKKKLQEQAQALFAKAAG